MLACVEEAVDVDVGTDLCVLILDTLVPIKRDDISPTDLRLRPLHVYLHVYLKITSFSKGHYFAQIPFHNGLSSGVSQKFPFWEVIAFGMIVALTSERLLLKREGFGLWE